MYLPTCLHIFDNCMDVQNFALRDGMWEPAGRVGEVEGGGSGMFHANDIFG